MKTKSTLNASSPENAAETQETQRLEKTSMLPVELVLATFPFVRIHSSVDVCLVFRFGPVHNLSLGISRLLKECIIRQLVRLNFH